MIETHLVHVAGARLAVHTAGAGPLAVLVHGFPLDHRMWLDQLRDLSGPDRRVAAVDLRGHGRSPWAGDAAHTMELLADDVAAVIRSFGGRADVVGLSMGGYVVLALWERHPELFRSVALVDTRSGADSEEGKAGRDAFAAAVVEGGRSVVVERMLPKLVAEGADLVVRARLRTMMEEMPVESVVADLRGMRDRPDRTGLLASIDVPALVMVGDQDVITPPPEAEALASSINGAELVAVAGAGHMVPMEAPQILAQALTGLWSRAG
jgi:pimeloyl-ACP methyl ester carboxylesterase